jgi:DNA-binding NarL/FixJ family response regulator
MEGVEPLAVLVVSADPLARAGLTALVGARADLDLAGECGPGEAPARSGAADALLWDVGADEAEGLAEAAVAVPVVALAGDEQQAGAALRAGARGVIGRGASPQAIAAALHAAVQGLSVVDPVVGGALLRPPGPAVGMEPLTPREREVLGLLAEGLGNKQIAARLGISDHTAKFHVNAILGKLGAESRAEAIVLAARAGLVVF